MAAILQEDAQLVTKGRILLDEENLPYDVEVKRVLKQNEELVVRMAQTGHRWRNPVWRHADGSFAEW